MVIEGKRTPAGSCEDLRGMKALKERGSVKKREREKVWVWVFEGKGE
jgi:hypothetical protein